MSLAKQDIKRRLADRLGREREVIRVVVFGSFLTDADPQDLDVAVFQDSDEGYLPLALKYRRATREIAGILPLDIIPLRAGAAASSFLDEIGKGEVIYER